MASSAEHIQKAEKTVKNTAGQTNAANAVSMPAVPVLQQKDASINELGESPESATDSLQSDSSESTGAFQLKTSNPQAIVQRLLNVSQSPISPFTGLNALRRKRLQKRFEIPQESWDSLKAMALSPTAFTFDTWREAISFAATPQAAKDEHVLLQPKIVARIDALSEKAKKHILVAKHAWHLVIDNFVPVPGEKDSDAIPPGSWESVKPILVEAAASPVKVAYKKVFRKVYKYGGQTVELTYNIAGQDVYVSDAWVRTKDE